MEKLIRDVIAKVRGMYKYDMDYNKILLETPKINIYLDEPEEKFVLRSLEFGTYDRIFVYSDSIKFISEDGCVKRTLCKYGNFEELLNKI